MSQLTATGVVFSPNGATPPLAGTGVVPAIVNAPTRNGTDAPGAVPGSMGVVGTPGAPFIPPGLATVGPCQIPNSVNANILFANPA